MVVSKPLQKCIAERCKPKLFTEKQRLSKALIFLNRQLKIHFLHFYQQLLQFLQFVRSQIFTK